MARNSTVFLFLLALLALSATPASATIYSWTGSVLTSSWSNSGNWANLSSPGQFDTAQFPSASYSGQPTTDTPGDTVGAVWDNGAGSVTIGGTGALTITGTTVNGNAATGVELDFGAGSLTINCPITMGANQQWISNSANAITVFSTVNCNSKAITLNTTGSGSLMLAGSIGNIAGAGSNNFFGNVTLTGTCAAPVVLDLGYSGSTTAGAATTTTIAAGGMLNILSSSTNVAIANDAVVNGGTIQNLSPTSGTAGIGWIAGQAGALTINSGLVNFDGLNVFFGHAAKGTINLNGGTYVMNLEPNVSTDGGTMNLNGGTLQLNANVATFAPTSLGLNVGSGGANINLNGFSTTISGSLANSGGTSSGGLQLNTTTGGTLTLSSTNTYTGVTLLNGGTLLLTNTAALLDSTFDTSGAGTLSLGSLTAATFGGLRGTAGTLNLMNNAATPANVALSVGNNGSNTTFNGTLTGGGSLTKIGSGVLSLTGSTSNYTGATNISAGALDYANTAAMPGTSTVSVSAGAALVAAVGGANPFTFGGSGVGSTNGLLAGAGPNGNVINWANNSMLGIDTTGVAGGSLGVSGYTSGSVGLAKLGSGTMVLSGTNTYSGPTKLFAGTLDVNSPYAIGTGTLNIAGGVIDNTSGGPVTLGNNPQVWSNSFSFGGSNPLDLGTGPVNVSGTNTLSLTLSAGTLEVDGNLSSNAPLTLTGNGTLLLTGSNFIYGPTTANILTVSSNLVSTGTTNVVSGGNFVFISPGSLTIPSGAFTASGTGSAVGTVFGNSGVSTSLNVSGGTFTQASAGLYLGQKGGGVLNLTAGLVSCGTATLDFDFNGQAGGHGTVNLSGGQLNASGFSSGADATGGNLNQINFNGGVFKLTAGTGADICNSNSFFSLNVQNGGAVINPNGFKAMIGESLVAAGSGGLAISSVNGGTLTLTGTNTYTGPTSVSGCTLIVSNSAVSAAASILPQNSSLSVTNGKVSLAGNQFSSYGINDTSAGTVTLNSDGLLSADQTQNNSTNLYTLVMNGGTLAATQPPAANSQHFTINNQIYATGASPSLISASIGDTGGGLTVDVAPGSQLTLSGTLADSGPVSLNKVDNGTLVITSPQNLYTGSTTVSGGTLAIDATGANTGALGATAVSVAGGATFLARGNTSIASGGSLGIAGGGSLDLRDGQLNTLTVNGNLSLGTGGQGSNVNLELGTNTADLVNVTGAAALTGTSTVNISLAAGGSVVPGSYDLITAASGLTAGNFTVGSKPAGFNSYTLSTPSSGVLILSITGNATPGTAYWTGAASRALSDSANQWGIGSTISTSNWSTTPDGLTDPQQVPGSITNVYFTASNAVGNAGGSLTTTLDTNYSINSLTFAPGSGTITSVAINTAANSLSIGSGGLTLTNTSNASATISGSGSVIVNGSQAWANNSSLPLAVNVPISALSGATTLTINGAGSGGAALGGVISDGANGGTLGLVLNQAGIVTLGGTAANTYSGGTTISSGLVRLMGAGALGNAAGSLTANGGSLDLGGNSVAVNGGLNGAAGTIYNNAGSGVAMITVGNGGSFSGNIADNGGVSGGSVALVFNGANALALSGTNTYSGGTTVAGGKLDINSNWAVGSGTLSLAGGNIDNTSGHAVTLGNVPQVWSSNFTFGGSNYLNLGTGPVSVTALTSTSARTITLSAGTLEVDGNITSLNPISLAGAGTLVLGGSNTISYSQGNVLGAFSNLTSTGTTSLSGGPFVTGASTTFTVASGLFTANVSTTVLGNNGAGSMLVSGGTFSQPTGNLALGQHASGVLTITGGLVELANYLEFTIPAGTSPGTVNLNGGQLDLPYFNLNDETPTSNEQIDFNGGLLQLTASSTNLFLGGSVTSGSNFYTLNVGNGGANIDLNGHATTIALALQTTGSGGLTVYSSHPGGQLTLTAANLYAGNTTIDGGIVLPANGTAFSGGTVTVNPSGEIYCITAQTIANPLVLSGTGADGAALEQGGASATTYTGPVSLAGNTTIHTDGSASLTLAGNVTLDGNTLAINGDGGSSTTFSGNIAADSGSLVCNAPGLTLSGSNLYSGGTRVIGGSLVLGSAAALGPGALAVNGGVLNLNGYGATVASFSGGVAGTVTNSNPGATPALLTVNQSIATTYSGLLRDGTGQFGLTLGGEGSLTLTGTNSYTGGTYVEGGTLVAANNEAIEDGTSLFVGNANELTLFGGVVPATAGGAIAAPATAPVPEPDTLALMAAGGVLLLLCRRWRRPMQ
jgi:fibronectin-binding autotransporter adhesin